MSKKKPAELSGPRDLVLDIDLDFFMYPIPLPDPDAVTSGRRYGGKDTERIWTKTEVASFLADQCNLGSSKKPLGRLVTTHDQAFDVWREWVQSSKIRVPFDVVHVDGHADLGGVPDGAVTELLKALPELSLEQRLNFRRGYAQRGLTEANYLVFAIACRWLNSLTYVNSVNRDTGHFSDPRDVHHKLFSQYSIDSGTIQLSHQPDGFGDPWPGSEEPEVPFLRIAGDSRFRLERPVTHMIVCQSPSYTTTSMNALLPVLTAPFVE